MEQADYAVELLINSNLTSYRISKETGITQATLGNYKAGKTKPTKVNALALIQYLSNPIHCAAQLPPVSADQNPAQNPNPEVHKTKHQGIPLLPVDAVAGVLSGNSITIMDYECSHYTIPLFKGAEFLIQVSGDSMQPKYYSGDIVACKRLRIDTFFQWNLTYVVDSEQGVLIKRILPGHNDKYVSLVSDNRNYPPFELARADIYSIALVIGLVRAE